MTEGGGLSGLKIGVVGDERVAMRFGRFDDLDAQCDQRTHERQNTFAYNEVEGRRRSLAPSPAGAEPGRRRCAAAEPSLAVRVQVAKRRVEHQGVWVLVQI